MLDKMRRSFCVVLVILASLWVSGVQGQSTAQTGSVTFTLGGYEVQGQLTNATIHSNTVTMSMSVDYVANTTVGQVSVTGSGEWYGEVNGTSLSGIIYNVKGAVRVCYVFFCGSANYIGYGTWAGTLSSQGQAGNGTFRGVIIFTSSDVPRIPLNQPIPISGTWNATF
jgi:hypothetical protein